MSIVANYVRLTDDALSRWRSDPLYIQQLSPDSTDVAEHLDIDRSWEAIAWLLSECKREEKRREAEAFPDVDDLDPDDTDAWNRAFDEAPVVSYAGLEPDNLLIAIEGRGLDSARERRLDYGYGPARVFQVSEVQEISKRLQALDLHHFREMYDPETMSRHMVTPEIWADEGARALEEYLIPYFERLRVFYQAAARREQLVVMFFS